MDCYTFKIIKYIHAINYGSEIKIWQTGLAGVGSRLRRVGVGVGVTWRATDSAALVLNTAKYHSRYFVAICQVKSS